MMRWFYTLIFYAALPLIAARLLWRSRLAPAYRKRIAERFGLFASPLTQGVGSFQKDSNCLQKSIWVHAVSVGETIAAAPLIRALLELYPDHPVVVTTMTPTGSERVRALFGDRVFHVYAPYDLPGCIARFLRRVRPRLLIIMETELWPNTIHACAGRDIPVLLANARLSEKSARGYARFPTLTRNLLERLSVVVAQNAVDGERFVRLGLPESQLRVSGSIKFDIELDAALVTRAEQTRASWRASGHRLIWIAASTHAGEDEMLLAAHRRLRALGSDVLLILVPRHPERFDSVANLIGLAGFSCVRRSSGQALDAQTAVLLGDTMGELLMLYGCADIAFIGGSLVERGGHNMLEPAAWSIPLLTGPSDFNFREISTLLQDAGALRKIADADQLGDALIELAGDDTERARRGNAARAVVESNRGALQRLLAAIENQLR